jgi:hypothetical protein
MPPKKKAKRGQTEREDQPQLLPPAITKAVAPKISDSEPMEDWQIPLPQMQAFIPQQVTGYVTGARVSHHNSCLISNSFTNQVY